MATVLFWEKPGCGTNARQIRALGSVGHQVIAKNLMTELWTTPTLLLFFGGSPIPSWFNPVAPRVTSGAVDPAAINAMDAIALMLEDRLLIRCPLIDAISLKCAGFDREPVLSLLGASPRRKLQGCTCTAALPPYKSE
ncbi:arsenate reductase family protein [Bradyrhizobium stylosanthis]|uniref:Nitrogenase-associated protein n=1 Tax=Bradyrhizobium stylosanthis TaxID=1803665 RepID=A0A560DP89_9BRAD|nr:arsenate reductase family protein [Bradyrhizobium stylosanthis]TWA98928.1 hypothetical protein FBZ96_105607 [Bradyrhizobium stylosanthis]